MITINKTIEKLVTCLTDGTVLSQAARTAKENQVKDLQKDLVILQQYLQGKGCKEGCASIG